MYGASERFAKPRIEIFTGFSSRTAPCECSKAIRRLRTNRIAARRRKFARRYRVTCLLELFADPKRKSDYYPVFPESTNCLRRLARRRPIGKTSKNFYPRVRITIARTIEGARPCAKPKREKTGKPDSSQKFACFFPKVLPAQKREKSLRFCAVSFDSAICTTKLREP